MFTKLEYQIFLITSIKIILFYFLRSLCIYTKFEYQIFLITSIRTIFLLLTLRSRSLQKLSALFIVQEKISTNVAYYNFYFYLQFGDSRFFVDSFRFKHRPLSFLLSQPLVLVLFLTTFFCSSKSPANLLETSSEVFFLF